MNSDITTTIRELFFRHDCVIIPGFGGFILNYVPATVDRANSLFHPPARRVSFNRNLSHNDGLLAGAISNAEGIGYAEARERIEGYASDLRRRLARGEQVVLEHIGTLVANREGNIQFEPDAGANYNLTSYGLEPVSYQPVSGYDVRRRVMKPSHAPAANSIPLRKMLVRAAIAVPVLIALVAVPLKTDMFRSRMEKASLNPLATAELEQNRKAIDDMPVITGADVPAQEVKDVAGNSPAISATESAADDTPAPAEEIVSGQPAVTFYIIAGSFQSEGNAKVMAGRLRSMGYNPEMIEAPNGYTRVAAGGFSDLASANAEKERLSANFEGLWVLKR